MKKFFLLVSLLASINGIVKCQDTLTHKRFSIGVNFSPNYSYRILKSSSELSARIASFKNEMEDPSFGFNTGFSIYYNVVKRLEAELGVQFSRQGEVIRNIDLVDISEPESAIGKVDSKYRYHYLEFPLRLRYYILDKKIFCYIHAGFSANIFLYEQSKFCVTYNDGSVKTHSSTNTSTTFNRLLFAVTGGLGLGYQTTEKFSITLEPIFRYSLSPIANVSVKQFNYSVGCQVGVKMGL